MVTLLLLLLSHSPPAITHPRSRLSSLSGRSSPRFLLLTLPLRGSAFLHPCLDQPCCLELSLTSLPLHTGARVLLLQRNHIASPARPLLLPSDSLLVFHSRRLIPNICPGNKALQDLAITVCPTSLPQHSSFLLALPNKQQSFKRLHFSLPIFKKLW